jgi:hypothetical protein
MDARVESWGGLFFALGGLGVVLTSAFYVASPPATVLPMPEPVMSDVLSGAVSGGRWIRAAGTVGVIADVSLIAGAFVLMAWRRPNGNALESVGWALAGIGTLVFVLVDSLSSRVLSQVASLPASEAAFSAFKWFFDVLFVLGTIAAGVANLFIFWSEFVAESPALPRTLSVVGLLVGATAIVSGFAYFAGIDLAYVIGATIAATGVIYFILGSRIAWTARGVVQSGTLVKPK